MRGLLPEPDLDPDAFAWSAIGQWPEASGMRVVREGLDYGHLTRGFLWDKVGRAVRGTAAETGCACAPGGGRERAGRSKAHGFATGDHRGGRGGRSAFGLRRKLLNLKLTAKRSLRGTPVLYCPFPYSRNARIIEAILETRRGFEVVVPDEHETTWPGAVPGGSKRPGRGGRRKGEGVPPSDAAWAADLHAGMCRGLKAQGVELAEADSERLEAQLLDQTTHIRHVERDLAALRPEAILVPTDNSSPCIECVLVARRMGIPSLMLQHGLDCERYYLDEAYASHIAVWGEHRKQRYARESEYRPEAVAVVGNPAYDGLSLPDRCAPDGRYWLWMTRPHVAEKCYAPSRRTDEGPRILDALLGVLEEARDARLAIKAHAFDDADVYRARITQRGLDDRARVIDDRLDALLGDAALAVTEDSTAGLDAMMAGKVLVHSHFAESTPVMPFVSYGAALPGFSPGQLAGALRRATRMAEAERRAMLEGQRSFISDFAGPCDGKATERFMAFVEGVLNRR